MEIPITNSIPQYVKYLGGIIALFGVSGVLSGNLYFGIFFLFFGFALVIIASFYFKEEQKKSKPDVGKGPYR